MYFKQPIISQGVPILKEVAASLVSLVEINGMPGQQTLHDPA